MYEEGKERGECGRIHLVDAPEMAQIRELDSVLSIRKANDIESVLDKS